MALVSEEVLKEVNYNYTEEELKEREELIEEANKKFLSYNLKWNFRSISYLVSKEKVSLNMLRSMVFIENGQTSFNLERAVHLLILCGLIGSKKLEEKEFNSAIEEAYEIMDNWVLSGRHLAILHCLIIDYMTKNHFFTSDRDSVSLDGLALLGIEQGLALKHLAVSEEARMQQMFHYTQI